MICSLFFPRDPVIVIEVEDRLQVASNPDELARLGKLPVSGFHRFLNLRRI